MRQRLAGGTDGARLPVRLRERIRVVPNGVDPDRFSPRRDRTSFLSRRRLQVVFLGRTIELKGPDILVRAAALLRRDDVEYRIIGSHGFAREASLTPFELRLRRMADASAARITFEPFIDRSLVPQALRQADVLVVPSVRSEASGLTAGEGMASGLAVVASRVGGLPEVVGQAGIIVPPGDPAALAEAIGALADDRDQLRMLQSAARTCAEAHDWKWAWSSMRGVLDEL